MTATLLSLHPDCKWVSISRVHVQKNALARKATLNGVGLDKLHAILEHAFGDLFPRLASRQAKIDVRRGQVIYVEPEEGGSARKHRFRTTERTSMGTRYLRDDRT